SAFQDDKGRAVGSVEAARKMAKKEPVEQNVVIPFQLITPDNVKDFK
ncbi:rhizopine-binding protein, partial [Pseudomonas carnis]|nr:rhizopine-binding protein [Pseudomonas carnis]